MSYSSPYLPLFLAGSIFTPIALVGLILPFWRERHWLGWLGIVLTFVGYFAAIGARLLQLPQFLENDALFSLSMAFSYLAPLGSSCGLLFWALDLPTTP